MVQGTIERIVSLAADRLPFPRGRESLPVEVRYQAYRQLRETALGVVHGVDTVSQFRLTYLGAVWSWTCAAGMENTQRQPARYGGCFRRGHVRWHAGRC